MKLEKMSSIPGDAPPAGNKIRIRFDSIGEALKLVKPKHLMAGTRTVSQIEAYLRSLLPESERLKPLFLCCASSFCPPPDQILQELFDLFSIDNELVFQYGIREVWG